MNLDITKCFKCLRYFIKALSIVMALSAHVLFAESGEFQDPSSTLKENTFYMSINRPQGTPLYRRVELIYEEVFRRLNINLKMEYHPLRRASVEVSRGNADGEPARIHAYGDWYPNLVRVEESIFPMIVAAYKTDTSITELNGWESLRNTEYKIEYPRGMKICEVNLSKTVKADRLSSITKTSLGLRKLAAKRIDIYIDDLLSVTPFLKNKRYKLQGKVHLAGIMQELPLYMYVHKKHKSLVPKLADSIKAVKSEGLIEHYHKIAFGLSDD